MTVTEQVLLTPLSVTGMAAEVVEHFLLHCCKYYNERQEMLNSINHIVVLILWGMYRKRG